MTDKWKQRFVELATLVGSWSKDRSRKIGCVVVGPDKEIRTMGFNGFPRGCNDDIEERHTRPLKYTWTEHAERNAIYNAARVGIPLAGCLIVTSLFPCADCARAIAQSGITCLICGEPDWTEERYMFVESKTILEEAGVKIEFFETT